MQLNSGDNIAKSKALLAAKGIAAPKSVVIVQKPFMLRRAYATTRKVWPEVAITMSAADVSWKEYAKTHARTRSTHLHPRTRTLHVLTDVHTQAPPTCGCKVYPHKTARTLHPRTLHPPAHAHAVYPPARTLHQLLPGRAQLLPRMAASVSIESRDSGLYRRASLTPMSHSMVQSVMSHTAASIDGHH